MILFFLLQFLLVVLGSLRSIAIAKGGKHIAALFNCLSFTLNGVIVFLLVDQNFIFMIFTIAITNVVGFYLAEWIFNLVSKKAGDKIWQITFLSDDYILPMLEITDLHFIYTKLSKDLIKYEVLTNNQEQSQTLKELMEESGIDKYVGIEANCIL